MDNNAFRTLVNQKVKSTKEIAREAVETEFRQKAQKRGGGGGRRSRGGDYDSDSASDNDDFLTKRRRDDNKRKSDEGKDEPEWKRRRKEKGAASSTTGYRDRAKERREGKNLDYSDTVATTIHNTNGDEYIDRKRQAELSKFLGGDEEHTHLVKGLDMALAQKVRREEMGGADDEEERVEEDLDQLLENAYKTQQHATLSSTSKKSSIAMMQPKSELGKSVQNYLLQQQERHRHDNPTTTAATISNTKQHSIQINPTKQNSIQRSHYTFSLDSTIQKRGNAWDLPQLQMVGGVSGQYHQSSFSERKSMTPLDGHLIATIRKKLDGTLNNSGGGGERKVMNDNEVEIVVDKHDNGVKQQQQPSSSPDKVDDSNKPSHNENNSNHKTLAPPLDNNKKDDSDDDSDDDIFANVGAYVPPTAVATSGDSDTAMPSTAATASAQTNDGDDDVATPPSAATTSKKHSSIFDNLITDQNSNDVNTSQKRQPMQLPHTQQQQKQHQNNQSVNSQNKNVIDRDVFGGNRKQDEQQQHSQPNKRRGPQTAAMEGVSMTNYQGGYGEEMDTDFLNEDGEDGYQKLKRRSDDDDDGGDGEDKTVDAIDDEED